MRGSREASRIAVRVHGVAARRRAGLASGARTCGAVAAATQQFATDKVVGIVYCHEFACVRYAACLPTGEPLQCSCSPIIRF